MEVFELWSFNSIISASKGQRILMELRRVRITEVRFMEILLYKEKRLREETETTSINNININVHKWYILTRWISEDC